MTHEVGGEQYIAVISGFGGSNGLSISYIDGVNMGQGQILAFKLNGTASMPSYTPEKRSQATIVPANTWSEATVHEGEMQYGNCVFRHGFKAMSIGVVPDLRRSPIDRHCSGPAVVPSGYHEEGRIIRRTR
jgi:quinohemoprotein ethanol dehydrogenase